ncbi:MAG: PAC2 family protein [Nanoarchaeota archaeon]|nr:PAC2 family protein [Nanoarchaeota archaeon]
MEIILKKQPKDATIIEGFPGFGLVGTITTEFLIETLKAEKIGSIKMKEAPPMVAIHDGNLVRPMGIFYDKKHNLIILHVMTNVAGIEWDVGAEILELAKKIGAKRIISVEGVSAPGLVGEPSAYYYSNTAEDSKKFEDNKVKKMKEGIVMGVTATLLLQADHDVSMSCIFAETHSSLPDSKAAAKVVQVLDKYLGMNLDYKPLLKQAEAFESKIKSFLKQSETASIQQKNKQLSYVG